MFAFRQEFKEIWLFTEKQKERKMVRNPEVFIERRAQYDSLEAACFLQLFFPACPVQQQTDESCRPLLQ